MTNNKQFDKQISERNAKNKARNVAIASFFIMGLGQWFNKQRYKAIPLFIILIILIAIEISTSGYFYAPQELGQYPVQAADKFNFFRDYGGFFTKSIWGFFSLGSLVIGDKYRTQMIVLNNNALPWLSADNSIKLMGEGIIALVVLCFFALFWVYAVKDAYDSRYRYELTGELEDFKTYYSKIWDSAFAYIIMLPALILMAFFSIVPFIFSFLMAFTNYTYRIKLGASLVRWTGFDAFKTIFANSGWLTIFVQVFIWTVIWALMASFTVYFVGFIQAMIVESKYVKGKKFWRLILILPWALPAMISLMTFKNIFNKDGLANQILFKLNIMEPFSNFLYMIGLQGQADVPIYWFEPTYNGLLAKAVVVFVNLWLGTPYFMMLIIGVLNTISQDLYEAASIDGATGIQKFRLITLPLVLRATVPVIIMTFSFNFNNFGAIYFLTGGGPSWDMAKVPESMRISGAVPGQTDILISWIYKLSFTGDSRLYNVAAVYSIIIFMIVGGFSVFNLARSKSFWEED